MKGSPLSGGEQGVDGARPEVRRQLKDRGEVGPQAPQPLPQIRDLLALGDREPPLVPAAELLLVEPQVVLLLRVEPDHPLHRVVVEGAVFGRRLA